MTTLTILVYRGKHGDAYWLADTPTRAAQAREELFRRFNEMGFYAGDQESLTLKEARAGNAKAIEFILECRKGYEYENWYYEYIEVLCNGGIPGLAELLDFDTYQKSAHGTAEYPPEAGLFYAALGLAGEGGEVAALLLDLLVAGLHIAKHTGEVANQVKKVARDDNSVLTAARKQAIIKELGGMFWYAAEIATRMGISLADVPAANLRQLYSRKERGTIKGDGDDR
jgi:NTP pyrophosphatase (non-canonical NTP hydrolase)